jgi:hypothetical protein
MTFPDTIPAWMTSTPAVPDCPPWCTEPAGHHNPTGLRPGDWVRFHVAYRQEVLTGDDPVTVVVASHESFELGLLATEPAGLTISGGEDLTPVQARRLLDVLTEATAVLSTITAGA